MGLGHESSSSHIKTIEGCEVPATTVPVNQFVAEHPVAGPRVEGETRTHTGELEVADASDHEVAKQFTMLADNMNDILLHAADEKLKADACSAVIETVVRLQNPQYATDQIEVRAEARRLHDEFTTVRFMADKFGEDQYSADQLHDASVDLLADLDIYITGTYDLSAMRERASQALEPMIKPVVKDEFERMTGLERHEEPQDAARVIALGSFASSRVMSLA